MKRLMKKSEEKINYNYIRKKLKAGENITDEEIKTYVSSNDPSDYNDSFRYLHYYNVNIPEEIQMYVVEKKPSCIEYIVNPTEEVQNFIAENHPSLITLINNPTIGTIIEKILQNSIHHDSDKRHSAITYIDGKIYEAHSHPECFKMYRDETNQDVLNVDHRSEIPEYMKKKEEEIPVACASLVEIHNDNYKTKSYTGIDKAIYIDPITLFNVTMQEVVDAIKKQYPDYTIYNDDEYQLDIENMKVKYTKLARLKKCR